MNEKEKIYTNVGAQHCSDGQVDIRNMTNQRKVAHVINA